MMCTIKIILVINPIHFSCWICFGNGEPEYSKYFLQWTIKEELQCGWYPHLLCTTDISVNLSYITEGSLAENKSTAKTKFTNDIEVELKSASFMVLPR